MKLVLMLLGALIVASTPIADISIISAEEAATNPFATPEQVIYYETLLSKARGLHNIYPSGLRVAYLGEQLSQFASIAQLPSPEDMESSTWLRWMHKLVIHERDDYAVFFDYYANAYTPLIFHWPLQPSITWLHEEWYNRIVNHPLYHIWQPAFRNGHSFMPDRVPTFYKRHLYRVERIQKIHNFLVLYEAIRSYPSDFHQIVEFGGGTGDMVPTLREIGFTGTHFVVDMEPMLLLQQYFLRYSYWPVYLATHLPTRQNRSTLLVSSVSSDLSRLLDKQSLLNTLLIATWSLTEAPEKVRNDFLMSIRGVGVMILTFADKFSSLSSIPWMLSLLDGELREYSYCIWVMPDHTDSSYLIARHYSFGDVVCSAAVGCTTETKRYGRRCILSV